SPDYTSRWVRRTIARLGEELVPRRRRSTGAASGLSGRRGGKRGIREQAHRGQPAGPAGPSDVPARRAARGGARRREPPDRGPGAGGGRDPSARGGAAAAVTERVRIGTAVIPAYTRTPPVIAGAAASCHELAPGRFVLGIGASSENIVQNWSGIPFRRPLARV